MPPAADPTPPARKTVLPAWLANLKPANWPWPLRWLAMPVVFVLLVFYYRDNRVGDGFFGRKPTDVEAGVAVRVDNYGRTKVAYADKSELPADGLSLVVVTKDDHAKAPERLAPYLALIKDDDWPLAVFLNASGFDPSGDPVAIRRAADGKELYKAGDHARVALAVPKRDGDFTVFFVDGTSRSVPEKEWVEKFMRLAVAGDDPKELDKMSDDELRKKGYERIPIEDAIKKGLVDKEGKPLPPRVTFQDLFKDKAAPKEKK